ncbi:AF-toxin biosynthesis protein 12-1 [Alternaria alternata]|nr:AF-toxin biosynthesis protein 12-1 [Alternaria alternata]
MNAHTRDVLDSASGIGLVRALAEGCYELGLALGVAIPQGTVDSTVEDFFSAPPVVTSILQDLRAGRPLELDALLGSCCRKALEIGTKANVMLKVYHALQARQCGKVIE